MSAGQQTGRYPEHEKLAKVREKSQAIGEFLDFGLPRMGFVLYEKSVRPCECEACCERRGATSRWHTEAEVETAVDGVVQITEYWPTSRTVQGLLADWFGIDQAKIDAEKDEMLAALRGES